MCVRRKSALLVAGAIVGFACGLFAWWLAHPNTNAGILSEAILRAKMLSYDYRVAYARPLPVSEDITIVTMDEETFAQPEFSVWPWPRSYHARVIRNLTEAGAKVIGVDIILAGVSGDAALEDPLAAQDFFYEPPLSEGDKELAAALAEAGNVVLAMEVVRDSVGDQDGAGELMAANFPLADFEDAAAGLGGINLPKDIDGTVRRGTTHITHQDERFPTMAVAVTALYTGRDTGEVTREVLEGSGAGHPALTADSFLIRYRAPIGRGFARIPYYQALEGSFDPAQVAGKIVLIGASAEVLQDTHRTPMYLRGIPGTTVQMAPMPGVEIHASAADTIINGNWVRPDAAWISLVMALVFSMLMGVLTGALRPLKALPIGWLPLMALVNIATFMVFWRSNLWVPSMHVMIGITLTYVSMTIYLELTAQKQERQLRQAWGRRVAPEVMAVILENPGLASVEGRLVHATVFFSDLRSFTTFCSNNRPEKVVSEINKHLAIATDVIRNHGGTVLKFIGDGVMAVFGDPVFQEDHARRALAASIEIQEKMLQMREGIGEGDWEMFVRVGLHSGELVAGDIGSGLLEYTVMGDTVSTAARLEGANKEFDTSILLSEATAKEIGDAYELVPLGEVTVRNRPEPLQVYTIPGGEKYI